MLYDKEKLWSNTDEDLYRSPEKLINRQTASSLVAAYDNKQFFTLDSTHIQVPITKDFNLKFILGLFNSQLMNFYYNQLVKEQGRVFAQVKTVILKQLPIKNTTEIEQRKVVMLVDKILSITQSEDYLQNSAKQAKVKEYEHQIDQLVYDLYGLTPEEIEIVEGITKGDGR